MRGAITEIFRLVADGIIRPDEGQELLSALHDGFPELFELADAAVVPSGRSPEVGSANGSRVESAPESGTHVDARRQPEAPDQAKGPDPYGDPLEAGREPAIAPAIAPPPANAEPEAKSPASDRESGVASLQSGPSARPKTMTRAPEDRGEVETQAAISKSHSTLPSPIRPGETVEIPESCYLQISSSAGESTPPEPMTSLAIHGVETQWIRVVRGNGVELRREKGNTWHLTWTGGMAFLEIPIRLAGLEIRGIPGSVGLAGYAGPFSCEDVGGGLTVRGAAAPFRIRDVRGKVRLPALALRDGISTIASVTRDLEIETARDASVTIRASSRVAPLGDRDPRDADRGAELDRGSGRRGVWRVGAGSAQLNIGNVGGSLRLQPPEGEGNSAP